MRNGQLTALLERHSNVIIVEEHQKNCGLGSAFLEILGDLYGAGLINTFPRVHRIAIPNRYVSISGNQQYLRAYSGLTLGKDLFVED